MKCPYPYASLVNKAYPRYKITIHHPIHTNYTSVHCLHIPHFVANTCICTQQSIIKIYMHCCFAYWPLFDKIQWCKKNKYTVYKTFLFLLKYSFQQHNEQEFNHHHHYCVLYLFTTHKSSYVYIYC